MPCKDAKLALPMSRREALQIGTGLFGLSLPTYLRELQASETPTSVKSCIFIFLAGGPSHFETFDPKPDASVEIRGLWKPTSTNVPGTQICEKLPLMASRMDKVAIVRSWQGRSGGHDTGSQHVTSGMFPLQGGQYFPNFGCLVSALFGSKTRGVPAHFGLPVAARYTNPPGYLGPAHAAVNVPGDPSQVPEKFAGLNLSRIRFEDRRSMLDQLDNLGRLYSVSDTGLSAHDQFVTEAIDMLTSGAMQRAMKLDEEPAALRERYGMNIYGQRVLLARRLIEAGARFVTINHAVQGGLFGAGQTNGTWDNHDWLFDSMMSFAQPPQAEKNQDRWHRYSGPGNLPQLDMSLSTLLDDLDERGMLDDTLVVVIGEFGRTPKINARAGRDHYPNAGCALLAGCGIARGAVIGATDRKGSQPATRPWRPEDFAASIYHALGVDPYRTHFPRLARPTPISEGVIIEGLFS